MHSHSRMDVQRRSTSMNGPNHFGTCMRLTSSQQFTNPPPASRMRSVWSTYWRLGVRWATSIIPTNWLV